MIKSTDFLLEGDGRGVLLIHGLTGTPLEMRVLAKGLHRAGFTVYVMQLAGHCGSVEDLIATTWQDWYASVEEAADYLAARVDQVFVGGLSMGAILALKLAAERPCQVAGVGVYGATFEYDGWTIPWTRYLSFLLPWFKRLGIGRHKMFEEQPPYGLRDERLRAQVAKAMHSDDSSQAGLLGNPWPALAEFYKLAKRIKKQLPQVIAPCLIAHASEDDIASVRNAYTVRDRVSGPTELLLFENSYHMITIDRERKHLIAESVRFFNAAVAQNQNNHSSVA